ncbi:MAG: hypothetical protein K5790_10350 [Nitrosopumilus sp.]|uniref:hypothetical protein n=1 Tax=Nitrosopumilus sp. TaxID=2024843 RepID=UPI00247D4751|nr:hypothetical protein [Nitrosopumilus sp.]MCV0393670.1 hypothetical protein [Nitrosopumilus sp.]
MNSFELIFYKGVMPIQIPNMQTRFLSEKSAKDSVKHAKLQLKRHGVTDYEITLHKESFESKGIFKID